MMKYDIKNRATMSTASMKVFIIDTICTISALSAARASHWQSVKTHSLKIFDNRIHALNVVHIHGALEYAFIYKPVIIFFVYIDFSALRIFYMLRR